MCVWDVTRLNGARRCNACSTSQQHSFGCWVSQQQLLLAVAVEKFAATVKVCSQSAGDRQPIRWMQGLCCMNQTSWETLLLLKIMHGRVSKWMVLFELAPRNRRWVSVSEPPLHTAHSYSSTTMPFLVKSVLYRRRSIVRSRRHPDQ